MLDPTFNVIDLIDSKIEKHKELLGPLYTPTRLLLGSLFFLVLVGVILLLPLVFAANYQQALSYQALLLLIYFILLQAIKFQVLERFVYSLCLIVISAAAAVTLDAESHYRLIAQSPSAVEHGLSQYGISSVKYDLFRYGFIRGMGNIGWALPVMFGFYTFYPRMAEKGEQVVSRGLYQSLWTALGLQILAIPLIFWQDDILGRFFASSLGAKVTVRNIITSYQWGYLVFSSLCLLLGLFALLSIYFYARCSDGRVLSCVVTGILLVQVCFMIVQENARGLSLYYPAARSTWVKAYKERSSHGNKVVFTSPFLDNLGSEALSIWQLYYSCETRTSDHFNYAVLKRTEFQDTFDEYNVQEIKEHQKESLFCQEGR